MIKHFLRDETGLELSEYAVAGSVSCDRLCALLSTLGTADRSRINSLRTATAYSDSSSPVSSRRKCLIMFFNSSSR